MWFSAELYSAVATLTDISTIPLTHLNHIDALLDKGPDWNYQTGNPDNTLYYTFSSTAAIMADNDDEISGWSSALTASQQAYARDAMAYLTEVTGILFVETPISSKAQVHFANADIIDPHVTAECAWDAEYWYLPDNTLTKYNADAIVYLDNNEWGSENANLAPGGNGYETLLHELGHMLGLKHPFDGDITLPEDLDDTSYTLMSYTSDGYAHAEFSDYDIAALDWLYGRDGLRGQLGLNSAGGVWLDGDEGDNVLVGYQHGDVLMGGFGNDTLMGAGGDDLLAGSIGDDTIDGGAGLDTIVYGGDRAGYSVVRDGARVTVSDAAGWEGTDSVLNAERLMFTDKTVALDIDGLAGSAYRLYQAAFDRTPDATGLGYWIDVLDSGTSLRDAAAGFMSSAEFARLYGSNNPDGVAFVSRLYQNILHRAPEQGGFAYWTDALHKGADKAEVMAAFSESAENKAALIGVIGDGFDYVAYTG